MILIYVVGSKKHHVERNRRLCNRIVDKLQHVFIGPVISIHNADIVPPGSEDPFVPGRDQSAVRLVDHPYARVTAGILVTDLWTAVR